MLKKCNNETNNVIYSDPDYWSRRRDEERKKKREEYYNPDNWLFDSEEEKDAYYKNGEVFPEEYYKMEWDDAQTVDDKNI